MRNQDKATTLVSLVITIIVLVIITGVGIAIIVCQKPNENIDGNVIENQKHCQHEYVITSKWDWLRDSYKTISKCSKCGKEVD